MTNARGAAMKESYSFVYTPQRYFEEDQNGIELVGYMIGMGSIGEMGIYWSL